MSKIKAITIEDNEAFLRQISKPIEKGDTELTDNIAILEKYCKQHERILAMAAVQLGIPKRLIYIKNTNIDLITKPISNKTKEEKIYNEARVLINPVIISKEGLTEDWESCASCLDNLGLVKRPYRIKVEFCDLDGQKKTEIFEGFESTVLSHEIDHLDGILHMDIADEVLQIPKNERKEFWKTHNGYTIISKTGIFEELLKK